MPSCSFHIRVGGHLFEDPDGERFEISDTAGRTLGTVPSRDALKPDYAGEATMGRSEDRLAEDRLAQAERQFREAETRVARQAAIFEELARPGAGGGEGQGGVGSQADRGRAGAPVPHRRTRVVRGRTGPSSPTGRVSAGTARPALRSKASPRRCRRPARTAVRRYGGSAWVRCADAGVLPRAARPAVASPPRALAYSPFWKSGRAVEAVTGPEISGTGR